ncbi:MAG TPA: heavy-metal-associated domain-containing protein [Anaerolineales bacterium]|nr:heavy-metal-associated domain-containing protein [Anaerolineales bacterium]
MKATYSVPAIHCGHCTHTIEMEVGELQGVESVSSDLSRKTITVIFGPPADDAKIRALLAEIEYPAEEVS